jgi:RimJ/RimL family protein N-acetyltransferase
MTEALGPIIEFGFQVLGLHQIEAITAPDNLISKKNLLGFGFSEEGILRSQYKVSHGFDDSHMFSILYFEWEFLNPGNN